MTSIAAGVSASVRSAHAIALLVVPRSIPTLKRAASAIVLRHLDFGLRDKRAGVRIAKRRQRDSLDAPATMQQRSAERRSGGHVADQADRRRVDRRSRRVIDSPSRPARIDSSVT